ncbi:MAG: hypothetical protein IT423_03535 [Pirellulaceae bacterium]|nr:hypothetical protein [Pirellulaceae bacterium]
MFQLLPCSNCQRTFSIREEVSPEALLKCPSCGNQFRIGELLDAFYSAWLILEDPARSADHAAIPQRDQLTHSASDPYAAGDADAQHTDAADDFTADTLPADLDEAYSMQGLDLELESEGLHEQADSDSPHSNGLLPAATGEAQYYDNVTNQLQSEQPASGSRVSKFKTRPRRAEGSGIWSVVQVVLGGAAAIPVTLLLLWYVVGKDVGAGPMVAKYAPWIVPKRFQGDSGEPAMAASRPRVTPPAAGESGFRNFDDVMPPSPSDSNLAPPDSQASTNTDATGTTDSGAADTNGSDAADAKPVVTDQRMVGMFETVSGVKTKIAAWSQPASEQEQLAAVKSDELKKQRIIAILDDLSVLGEQLADVPPDGGAVKLLQNDLRNIVTSMKKDQDLETWFKKVVRAQFNGLPRPNSGRVFLANVGQVEETETMWVVRLADTELKWPQLQIPKSVTRQLTPDDQLFLLGSMLSPTEATTTASPTGAPIAEVFRASFLYKLN